MLAVSGGRIVLLSTPWGQRGFFFDVFVNGGRAWQRVKITAEECPRISPAWLQQERESLPGRIYRQEYYCTFEDTEDQVFPTELVMQAVTPAVQPLFAAGTR
jgi:hypothetical protein